MEIKAIIRELSAEEAILETEAGETITLPRRMVEGGEIGRETYLSVNSEPKKAAREVLNELLGNEPS